MADRQGGERRHRPHRAKVYFMTVDPEEQGAHYETLVRSVEDPRRQLERGASFADKREANQQIIDAVRDAVAANVSDPEYVMEVSDQSDLVDPEGKVQVGRWSPAVNLTWDLGGGRTAPLDGVLQAMKVYPTGQDAEFLDASPAQISSRARVDRARGQLLGYRMPDGTELKVPPKMKGAVADWMAFQAFGQPQNADTARIVADHDAFFDVYQSHDTVECLPRACAIYSTAAYSGTYDELAALSFEDWMAAVYKDGDAVRAAYKGAPSLSELATDRAFDAKEAGEALRASLEAAVDAGELEPVDTVSIVGSGPTQLFGYGRRSDASGRPGRLDAPERLRGIDNREKELADEMESVVTALSDALGASEFVTAGSQGASRIGFQGVEQAKSHGAKVANSLWLPWPDHDERWAADGPDGREAMKAMRDAADAVDYMFDEAPGQGEFKDNMTARDQSMADTADLVVAVWGANGIAARNDSTRETQNQALESGKPVLHVDPFRKEAELLRADGDGLHRIFSVELHGDEPADYDDAPKARRVREHASKAALNPRQRKVRQHAPKDAQAKAEKAAMEAAEEPKGRAVNPRRSAKVAEDTRAPTVEPERSGAEKADGGPEGHTVKPERNDPDRAAPEAPAGAPASLVAQMRAEQAEREEATEKAAQASADEKGREAGAKAPGPSVGNLDI